MSWVQFNIIHINPCRWFEQGYPGGRPPPSSGPYGGGHHPYGQHPSAPYGGPAQAPRGPYGGYGTPAYGGQYGAGPTAPPSGSYGGYGAQPHGGHYGHAAGNYSRLSTARSPLSFGVSPEWAVRDKTADRLSLSLFIASPPALSFSLPAQMMDGKWLTSPDSHVEKGFSLCPSAGLHSWSDDSGNAGWKLNCGNDRWVKRMYVCVWLHRLRSG